MSSPSPANQWIEIDGGALRANLELLRRLVNPDSEVAAVVKANAYGHGLAEVVGESQAVVDWFAVHTAAECRAIRELGCRLPVLVMGLVTAADADFLDDRSQVLVSTPETLAVLGELRRRGGPSVPVHIKVDTGTKRQGVGLEQIPDLCRTALDHGLEIRGVATHFANIEDTLEHAFARTQLQRFNEAIEVVRGFSEVRWIHAACSAATLLFPETTFNLVRVGISMYGHWPSRETLLSWRTGHPQGELELRPVLRWMTVVGQIQHVAAGQTVGYGRTWTALRQSRLAVLPVGYSDGYPRALGNRARVLVRGLEAPVVGRVCMNIMLVDVTDHPEIGVGDPVVLLGGDENRRISAEELAELSGTINYELLARLGPHIPRRVVDPSGDEIGGGLR
jgi:alanine racemase